MTIFPAFFIDKHTLSKMMLVSSSVVVWENCLYSVNHVLNKCWLARQEVEVEQREQEYSGKQEVPSAIPAQNTEKQDVTFQAVKGTEICA